MPVNLNLNVDCTDVVKRSALPVVTRLQSHTRYQRKQKLIAMAKECSSKLKIADWNVVEWPPEKLTFGLVEAIAASKKCSSVSQCRKVAWELSGVDHPLSEVQRYVAKYLDVPDTFFTDFLGTDELFDTFRQILASLVEGISSQLVCSAILNSKRVEARQGMLFPLWSFVDETRIAFPDWSAEVVTMYQNEWNTTIQELHQLNDVYSDGSWSPDEGFLRYAIDIVDVYATARLGYLYGIDFQIALGSGRHNIYSGRYSPLQEEKTRPFDFVAQKVVPRFLSHVLMSEYIKFIHQLLQKRSSVGKRTNFARLRDNHVFSRRCTHSDRGVFAEFTSSFSKLKIGKEILLDDRNDRDDIDCLGMINAVLGGRTEECTNIQVSLVHQVLGTNVAEKSSLLGKIGRRHVRMLKCGRDNVLAVPYLNMILLKLNDSRWVRDLDVDALQPLRAFKRRTNEGAIRRAANILLALEYPKEGEPFVNEIAFKLLMSYAEKGELYSMELRSKMLCQLRMKERVGVGALTITAKEVFGRKERCNVAGLVREMVHDRLLMRSDNGWEREENEYDAYYDAVYLKRGYSTRNNVEWTQGVPMHGIFFESRDDFTGMMGEDAVKGSIARFRGSDERLLFWELEGRTGDEHRPSLFIGSSSRNKILNLDHIIVRINKYSYVGRYCPCSVVMKHDVVQGNDESNEGGPISASANVKDRGDEYEEVTESNALTGSLLNHFGISAKQNELSFVRRVALIGIGALMVVVIGWVERLFAKIYSTGTP